LNNRLAGPKEAPAALESATGEEGRDGEHGKEWKEAESEPLNRATAAPILRTSVYRGRGGIFWNGGSEKSTIFLEYTLSLKNLKKIFTRRPIYMYEIWNLNMYICDVYKKKKIYTWCE
jgi:hypothetical protein